MISMVQKLAVLATNGSKKATNGKIIILFLTKNVIAPFLYRHKFTVLTSLCNKW